MRLSSWINKAFDFFFGEKLKHYFERLMLVLAVGGFIIHLILIELHEYGFFTLNEKADQLFRDPISAIYTPFSFILIYEVYLLILHLPRSFTTSIAKQYEIISLIEIRRIFKDITKLNLADENWIVNKYNQGLFIDLVGFLILFFFIFIFDYLRRRRPQVPTPKHIDSFITFKKAVSVLLIPILLGLAIFSLSNWIWEIQRLNLGEIAELSDINTIFYNEFFTILILVDVLVLIVSLWFTDRYSQLVRNAGFVISTILIRLSFSVTGLESIVLILLAVLFGILILRIYNALEREELKANA